MTVHDDEVAKLHTQADVDSAFAVVARIQTDLYDLEDVLEEQTGVLAHQLRLYGMHLHRAGERADPELIHRLYWEAPSLATQSIFEAFALRAPGDVYRIAGPRELGLPCKDCQTVITYRVKNRTELKKLRSNHRCEQCAAKEAERIRRARARDDAEWEQIRKEENEAMDAAMVAYVLAHPDLLDEPAGESMYVDIFHSARGGATVRLGTLNAIRDELRSRQ